MSLHLADIAKDIGLSIEEIEKLKLDHRFKIYRTAWGDQAVFFVNCSGLRVTRKHP